ncbi:hypothetical protein [Shewanella baltica]|uniref:hypothetical protein n=1 Tax=Shewanella baltica TaxID=62322 RepID=UPI00217E259F|nr:hypothetical protein [Shewanella baltica]MCS6241391.1 hypothetical protein [Shewanella baltica]
MDIEILGPFDYLPFQKDGASLYSEEQAWKPGIYFWVFNLGGSFLINYIGIASTSIAQRQSSHLSSFLTGQYDIYNTDSLSNGELERAYSPGDGHGKFSSCLGHLDKQLNDLQFFFAPIEVESSILKRIETAFITHVRDLDEASVILDNGSVSRYRRDDEDAIPVNISTPIEIKGLPSELLV